VAAVLELRASYYRRGSSFLCIGADADGAIGYDRWRIVALIDRREALRAGTLKSGRREKE